MNEKSRVITFWFAVRSYCPLACLASFQWLEAPVKYTTLSIRSMLNDPNFLPKFCPDCPSYIYSELPLRRTRRNHDNLLVLWEALPKQESAARQVHANILLQDGEGSGHTMEEKDKKKKSFVWVRNLIEDSLQVLLPGFIQSKRWRRVYTH